MRGGGYADVLPVLQVSDNKADAVPCERLLINFVEFYSICGNLTSLVFESRVVSDVE